MAAAPYREVLSAGLSADDCRALTEAIQSLERTFVTQTQQCKALGNKRAGSDHREREEGRCKAPTRTDKVTVYLRVVFLKIGEIDTLKENYAADVFIEAKWREPALDQQTLVDPDEINWESYWNPKLSVENCLQEPKESVWYNLTFDEHEQAMVHEKRRLNGSFLENLELNEFPFDTQDLTITVTTERSEAEVSLEEDNSDISMVNVMSFVDEQEWRLHNHVETWKRLTTKAYQNSKHKHPALSASCRATRRPGFFIWNILLVMLFICSLSFATFSVNIEKPENRLQLSFILVLTTITFKFVVNQSLPRISYLTYLDKYILTSMGILCLICVWHATVPSLKDKEGHFMGMQINKADRIAALVLGSLYVSFHLFFFFWIYFHAWRKRSKIFRKDEEHKEKLKNVEKQHETAIPGRWFGKVEPY